mgnify:CR=1 FL=1
MPEKAITDYIGTVVAENQASYECTPIDTPIFTILFMGYMRKVYEVLQFFEYTY